MRSCPRLELRAPRLADWERVHEWASRPEVCRYQVWGPNSPDETRAFVAAAVAATVECPPGPFASTYIFDDEANSMEIFCSPVDHDRLLGFEIEIGFAPDVPLDA